MSSEEMMKASELDMPNEKAIENKKADKRAFKQLIIALAIGGVVGFLCGYFGISGRENVRQIAETLMEGLNWITPFANLVLPTVVWIFEAMWLRQARRIYTVWDGEDESVIEKVEMKISYGMVLAGVNMILCFFFFGMGFHAVDFDSADRTLAWMRYGATMMGIIYSMTITVIYQRKLVNMTKEINPEKQGSVYDIKFNKIWLESCDESEKLTIYKAAYASYQFTSIVCVVLDIFCIVGIVTWDLSVFPMTMVTIIWLAMTIRYQAECIRLSKHIHLL